MWVPEMPFQMACQADAGLKERPLAFLSPGAQRTPCLWLVNRLARAEGVAPGEPMDQALRRLPGLRVLDPAPQTWWEAQGQLGEFLQHWSPQGLLGRMGEALVELGGGTPGEVVQRTQRFVRTLTQVAAQYRRRADTLESADLRHPDGYAVRLRGVTTVSPEAAAKAVAAKPARR